MVLGGYTLALLGNYILIKIYIAWELGRNQLIVQFASAAHPNLELENPTFLGRKNEVSATDDMWLQQGWIGFFTQPFVTVHFPAN